MGYGDGPKSDVHVFPWINKLSIKNNWNLICWWVPSKKFDNIDDFLRDSDGEAGQIHRRRSKSFLDEVENLWFRSEERERME